MAEELLVPGAEPVATEPDPLIPSDDAPLSEHEAAFGPPDPTLDGDAKVKADEKREKIRHRAKSQLAGPGDAPRIQELTKKLREAEAERDTLKARSPLATSTAPAQEPVRRDSLTSVPNVGDSGRSSPQGQQPAPTRTKPSEDEIGSTYATYADFVEDLTDWKVEQREAATARTHQERQWQDQQNKARQDWESSHQGYHGKLAEFVKTHPDYQSHIDANPGLMIPPAPYAAIVRHDNGPAFLYHLLTHPDQLAEVLTLWDEKPPSDVHVANATRWLSSRAQAVVTGSAAPAPPLVLASRPPNPVRTGPLKTGDDPPGDDASLAEHERAFGHRRRGLS